MTIIATHRSPDHDALCSSWLIARYIVQSTLVQIAFVPQGTKADDIEADFVTDVGLHYDTVKFFDHHQDGEDETTSATSRVFTRIWSESFTGDDISHLNPLVEWVTNGDWGRNKMPNNLNYLLQGLKLQQKDDAEQATTMFAAYDHVASMLADGHQIDEAVKSLELNDDFNSFIKEAVAYRQTMKQKFEECLVYQGEKNGIKMCILVNAPMGLTNYAYDIGFDVVAYLGEPVKRDGAFLYPRGIVRRNEVAHRVHLGNAVNAAIAEARTLIGGDKDWNAVIDELESWFCHPAGFMVGLSNKANSPKLLECGSAFRDAVQLVFSQL